eukprot:3171109-Ditylum_brightwellii.AAC.1
MGVGGKDISTMMAILDLPRGENFSNNATSKIKDGVAVVIHGMAVQEMAEGLDAEINATLDKKYNDWKIWHNNNPELAEPQLLSFEEWEKLPADHEKKRVPIIVCFDMGWQ